MRKGVRASTIAVLSLAVSGFCLVGCGIKEPPPFDPLGVQKDAKDAAAHNNLRIPMYALPTTLQDLTTQPDTMPVDPDAPKPKPANPHVHLRPESPATTGPAINENYVVRMTLQSIIQRSVAHSTEVKVAGFDAAIAKTKIMEAEGKFDPVFFTNLKYEHQDQPFAGQAIQNPHDPSTSLTLYVERGEVYTLEPGIKQVLPSGGEVSLSYQFQYNYLIPERFVLNPYWDDQLKFQLTQPLLRNAGVEVNEARITIARNDTRVAILDFRKALEDNIAELEKDYWQLEEAEQEVKIQENLLKQTSDTAKILFDQAINGGAVARGQTSQAQASIRDREAVLVRAKARLGDVSDDIKRRMSDPEFPVAGPLLILPLDIPAEDRIQFDVAEQVSTALANRLELGEQSLKIKDAEVALNVAINNAYPKLDLSAAITLEGIAQAPNASPNQKGAAGNFANTFHSQWEADGHIGWSLGFAFELPIGNQEARAIIRRAYDQRLQAIMQYRTQMDTVTLDVTTAIREVQTSWNEVGARRQAHFAQADQLAAFEDRRLNGEPLTPPFVQLVLDAQERLADAERQEALALASYQVAIARLERAKGMLLRYNNVILAEDQFRGMDQQ
jgi:outer membrane protein TolC